LDAAEPDSVYLLIFVCCKVSLTYFQYERDVKTVDTSIINDVISISLSAFVGSLSVNPHIYLILFSCDSG